MTSENIFIEDDESLQQYWREKGADDFFIHCMKYRNVFKYCGTPDEYFHNHKISLQMADRYYPIMKELSDFIFKLSKKYGTAVTKFTVNSTDNDSINMTCKLSNSMDILNIKFEYKRNMKRWLLLSVIYQRRVGYSHNITIENWESVNRPADYYIIGTSDIKHTSVYIDDENSMRKVHENITNQSKSISHGLNDIRSKFNAQYLEFATMEDDSINKILGGVTNG